MSGFHLKRSERSRHEVDFLKESQVFSNDDDRLSPLLSPTRHSTTFGTVVYCLLQSIQPSLVIRLLTVASKK